MSTVTILPKPISIAVPRSWGARLGQKLSCALFGHKADKTFHDRGRDVNLCPCGQEVLKTDGTESRISHVVSCFLLGHQYISIGSRENHHEYGCRVCGHPLLFPTDYDPYQGQPTFRKKVRYLCNLLGHKVHTVTRRSELTEYACYCGHSFLKREAKMKRVAHPLVCLWAGHFVQFVEYRNNYAEYCCRNCGHTFCFKADS